eukprot:990626-Prorocentrum_minimum.AAC.1
MSVLSLTNPSPANVIPCNSPVIPCDSLQLTRDSPCDSLTLLSSTLAGWLPWAWSAAEKGAVSAKGLAPPGEDHDRGPGAGLTSRPTKPPCVPKPTDSAQCRSAPRSLRLASYSVRAVDRSGSDTPTGSGDDSGTLRDAGEKSHSRPTLASHTCIQHMHPALASRTTCPCHAWRRRPKPRSRTTRTISPATLHAKRRVCFLESVPFVRPPFPPSPASASGRFPSKARFEIPVKHVYYLDWGSAWLAHQEVHLGADPGRHRAGGGGPPAKARRGRGAGRQRGGH